MSEALAELAQARLDLARAGAWDALAQTEPQLARLRATTVPGPADRPALERALAAEAEVAALAEGAMDGVRRDLARLHRGRQAVAGYGQLKSLPPRPITAPC